MDAVRKTAERLATAALLFGGPEAMLEQIRRLFLALCLIWPLLGVPSVLAGSDSRHLLVAAAAALVTEAWWCVGYRRRSFPGWSWLPEGIGVGTVLWASTFPAGSAFLFAWINFRALYGPVREKVFGGAVTAAILVTAVALDSLGITQAAFMAFTAVTSLLAMHLLSTVVAGRDRAARRQRAVLDGGAALMAATTRAEAVQATLVAALGMDASITAAAVATLRGANLRTVAAAGRVHDDATDLVLDIAGLPDAAVAAFAPDRHALLTGADAEAMAGALRLEPRTATVLAPLAVHGEVFGLLILVLDEPPTDELPAAVTALAEKSALALDQLLASTRLRVIVEHSPDALFLASDAGTIRVANPAAEALIGRPASDLIGRDLRALIHPDDLAVIFGAETTAPTVGLRTCRIRGRAEEWVEVEMIVELVTEHDGSHSLVANARDIAERQRLELELRHAQKLESVGRLAGGIAHEINTPIQFVGDNVRFLRDAFTGLLRLHETYTDLAAAVDEPARLSAARSQVHDVAYEIDAGFVLAEVPVAIEQTLEGVDRVARIVSAMKAFGHPGTEEKSQVDLNDAIANTLIVANNELKYVADVETDLTDLPPVRCHLGDINQVVLNLVVNAAHAVGAASAEHGRGVVRVSTRLDGDHAVIEVADTGTGIDPAVADKVFEPFFTTKEVGTGTGQGLALARSLVVDRHGGTIDFTSQPGRGTAFTVRLPVDAPDRSTLRSVSEPTEALR